MHPIIRMTTGSAVEQLAWRVRYGVLTREEALAKPGLTKGERDELERMLADDE
jgi:hypothetical protein